MSTLFAPQDKDNLYAIFQPDEHEYRVMYSVGKEVPHATHSGKTVKEWSVYSVYIKRDAIINRLNQHFFGEWSSGFLNPQEPCQYQKDHVDCAMHMTIRGVRMEYNGSQAGTGENGAKGAATDAFKRVASQWGIGLYLQHAPTIMTKNPDALDKQGKKHAEQEVQNKITQWIASLLADQNRPVEITRPSNAEQVIDDIDEDPEMSDDQPDPQWIAHIKDLTKPLYVDGNNGQYNPFFQNGSVDKALKNGVIDTHMSATKAAIYLLMYRAETDYGMDADAVQAAIGGKVTEALGASPEPGDFESVWATIRNEAIALGLAS